MNDLVKRLREHYGSGLAAEAADALAAQTKEIEALREALEFVERWVVINAKHETADACLGVIRNYPPIKEITDRYAAKGE